MEEELLELGNDIVDATEAEDTIQRIKELNLMERLSKRFVKDGFINADACTEFSKLTGLTFAPRTIQDLDKQYMAIGVVNNGCAIEFYKYPPKL